MKTQLISLLTATLLAGPSFGAVTFVFDNFQDVYPDTGFGPGLMFLLLPSTVTTPAHSVTVSGGTRVGTLQHIAGGGTVSSSLGTGALTLAIDTLNTSGKLTLDYTFSGVNALAGGGTVLEVVGAAQTAASPLSIQFFSGANSATQNLPVNPPLSPLTTSSVALSSFTGVDFTNITGMKVTWQASNQYDGKVTSIRVTGSSVPETGSSAFMLMLGCMPIIAFRLRRSRH